MSVRVRRAVLEDADAVAAVHVNSWAHAYRGIVDSEYLEHSPDLSIGRRAEMWRSNLSDKGGEVVTLVAHRVDALAGFITYGRGRNEGSAEMCEVYALYLEPSCFRSGIGRALMEACFKGVLALGCENLYLWVLKDNAGGRKFYAAMGGVLINGAEQDKDIGGKHYSQVRYEWSDIKAILNEQ